MKLRGKRDTKPRGKRGKEVIVAIDLGMSCTAYCWRLAHDEELRVGVPDMEPDEEISGKTATALLVQGSGPKNNFKPSGVVEAYGLKAKERCANSEIDGAQLFQHFKMELHKSPSETNLEGLQGLFTKSVGGQTRIGLEDVFVLALSYIKDAVLKMVTTSRPLKASDVEWILTVPVCCSNPAKAFMRNAAIQAGLIEGQDDDESLVLCLEPIAACLGLEKKVSFRMNGKYLVVDSGGGTVDASAFTVTDIKPLKLSQLGEAGGGSWGATNVDRLFEGFFEGFLYASTPDANANTMKRFLASSDYLKIMQTWERAKINLRDVSTDCRIDVSELSDSVLNVTLETLDNARMAMNKTEVLVGGNGTWDLLLRPVLMRRFFKPNCDRIATMVTEKLNEECLEGITAVIMVGGFSSSVHLQEAITTCVHDKYPEGDVQVVVPDRPDLAVVQGATNFSSNGFSKKSSQAARCSWKCLFSCKRPFGDSGAPLFQPAPAFEKMTASHSYGILSTNEAGVQGTNKRFDALFVKGMAYDNNHKELRVFKVKRSESFRVSIASSSSTRVKPGENNLAEDELNAVQVKQYTVLFSRARTTVVQHDTGAEGSAPHSFPNDDVHVFVELTVRVADLHILISEVVGGVSDIGNVLVREVARFK